MKPELQEKGAASQHSSFLASGWLLYEKPLSSSVLVILAVAASDLLAVGLSEGERKALACPGGCRNPFRT